MNADTFAEWFHRRGYKVVRTDSSHWVNQGPRVYQAFPYHWVISPSREELSHLLNCHRAFAARYSTPLTAPVGAISYHCIMEKSKYNLTDLPRRARNAVRKGLRTLTVEPISFDRLARDGWQLRLETMQRQHRTGDENQAWWERMCQAADDLPGFEAWGAICQGRLVAALLAARCDECYTLLFQQSATKYLNSGANSVLAYIVTHQAIERAEITCVFYGLESLNASDDVDTFKLRMGYTAIPLRQRVVFNTVLSPFINYQVYRLIRSLARHYPTNSTLSKTEGMLRFYHNGRQSLDHQVYPAALDGWSDEVRTGSIPFTQHFK